ncbi:dioxygenase [Frankia sp. CNm7]|uniref:Dioxygenase n=1 Tax=Frankia nepalensis TaxID=1836974 RepID=A0A937RMZ6_9ACTN|nr:class III extradiol ring-cleavage dioxygenase [Frankia nepalensis]MBL7500381.1 dioxygenase [Frankia nepalensis]MBL7508679.1 dioxygenase [Frankia nepalensis]MBL7519036.1 dioxygenase [Frankia nepalensis]MBL7628841.1 dioxygenase [Frankia nepalensis]
MSSRFPDVPAGAFDAFIGGAVATSRSHRAWTPADGALPALFVSHGAPPLFDDGPWMDELLAWATALPKPRAILIVSAHWEQAPARLSASMARTPLVYDFGGFDRRYYELKYPTPDAGRLAGRVRATLAAAGSPAVHEDRRRGLDHGAWVPLKVMYPLADVPVLQLSLPSSDPGSLLELGKRLRPLRDEGVLVIGSGFMTHGLPFLREAMLTGRVPGWSRDFDAWAADALDHGDVDELAAYQAKAPGMPYAHPTVEHFVPLFVTLGAATDPGQPVTTTIVGTMWGLSRRSFQVS